MVRKVEKVQCCQVKVLIRISGHALRESFHVVLVTLQTSELVQIHTVLFTVLVSRAVRCYPSALYLPSAVSISAPFLNLCRVLRR